MEGGKIKMERKELLVIVLIGLMLLTVGLQTIQIAGLAKAQVAPASAPAKATSSGSPVVPTNLQDLPSMVGGC